MKRALFLSGFFFFIFNIFAQKPVLVLPVGHTANITSAQFSPDGKKVVTASFDKSVKVWDVATGALLLDLKGHTAAVISAQFSSDGKKIVTASVDNFAKIWDATTGALLVDLKGHTFTVWSSQFSPDGKKVATGSWDNTAKIWDATSGALLFNLKGHIKYIQSAEFSPDGKKIVTASDDSTAKIWDVASGRLLYDLRGHVDKAWIAHFSPDNKKILTASNDKTAKIWDVATGALLFDLKGHTGPVYSAEFSPDGNKIITTSNEKIAKIWDSQTGSLLGELKGSGSIQYAEFSPDGKKIVAASGEIWDVATGTLLSDLIRQSPGGSSSAKFSTDSKKIVTVSADYTVKIWDAATSNLLSDCKGHSYWVSSVRFSLDGKKFVTATDYNNVKIWDTSTGDLLNVLRDKTDWLTTAQFSPDGKKVITTSYRQPTKIWDAVTGELIVHWKGPEKLLQAQFSPDGKQIITLYDDSTSKIWDAATGELIGKGPESLGPAQFSPDGKKIATQDEIDGNYSVKIWDTYTRELLSILAGHTEYVTSFRFSPDGKKIVTTSYDHTAKIWDVATGSLLEDLKGHTDQVYTARFSPDGKKIITGSSDNTVKIWDVRNGKMKKTLKGDISIWSDVWTAQFSPDGKILVTAYDNTAEIWDAATEKLLQTISLGTNTVLYDVDFGNNRVIAIANSEIKLFNLTTGKQLVSFFAIDSSDFLAVDPEGHFDGTEAARKMLYYVCNSEIIKLDQIKDLCWEPGLVEKIMGTNKEPIKAKRLNEISICGNTPIIENIDEDIDLKKFKIKRRGGGIGELAIYINQKEVEKIPVSSLVFTNDEAIVSIDAEKYKNYFEDGKENSIQLQARTADLSISSKGAVMQVKTNSKPTTAPNLYAIIAGVSDYKGDKLDLRFAAKDAEDFSNALQESARALLNIDGKEHVFVTTLVSNSPNSPSKSNISKAFADIKNKAKANDIVVVYLSGHGENFGTESTNFYYLTEDASSFELSGIEKEVAISTNEFAEWLKAIAAGKQVLILDACASGKLAEDMMMVMKAGIPSDQIRALDRLNSRTGTFILSGAAANQSAYETSIYGQGLLTYSLLYGMKSGTALKDNQFVDVDKLFQYCADKVKELAAGIGGIQDPVISKPNGGASFDIGKIDETVASKIVLALPKPIFTNSKFYNKETDDDNLGLERAIDNLLNEYASKGKESKLVFTEKSQLPESYKLVGSYQIINNTIEITVRLKKGSTEMQKFEIKGDAQHKYKLALEIIERVNLFFKE